MMYRKVIGLLVLVALGIVLFIIQSRPGPQMTKGAAQVATGEPEWPWEAPDSATIPKTEAGDLVRYGRALISHTAHYLGPKGTVARISNGMNCQNCHLDGGTKPWGNNYSAVSSTYPRYRD